MQLHNHTHYSLLDGASKIPDLVKRAKELNMPAVGITDHGNMHGAYEMWSTAVKEGVKPIIGIEAYVTPETARQDQTRVSWDTNWNPDIDPQHRRRNPNDVSGGGLITHLTMWAETDEGLVNLMKASTDANLEDVSCDTPEWIRKSLPNIRKALSHLPDARQASSKRDCCSANSTRHYVRQANCRIFSDVTISISNSWTTV